MNLSSNRELLKELTEWVPLVLMLAFFFYHWSVFFNPITRPSYYDDDEKANDAANATISDVCCHEVTGKKSDLKVEIVGFPVQILLGNWRIFPSFKFFTSGCIGVQFHIPIIYLHLPLRTLISVLAIALLNRPPRRDQFACPLSFFL